MWPIKKDMHALLWNNSDLKFNKYSYLSIFFKGTFLKERHFKTNFTWILDQYHILVRLFISKTHNKQNGYLIYPLV